MTKPRELPPETVTRFYGNADFALDVLTNNQIAFVHVSLLNDPFDPYFFFETDFEDSYNKMITYVRNKHPNDLGWFRAHVTPLSWNAAVQGMRAYLQNLRNSAFVLSTCSTYRNFKPQHNLYMWGHYASGHRGLAIEFDTQALAAAVLAHHKTENKSPFEEETDVWAKIEYAESFAPLTAKNIFEFVQQVRASHTRKITAGKTTALETYYNRMSIIKANVWEREAEWRLMWTSIDSQSVYKCPITANSIRAVYLGYSLSEPKLTEIVAAARASFPEAALFRACKRLGDLALDFEPL